SNIGTKILAYDFNGDGLKEILFGRDQWRMLHPDPADHTYGNSTLMGPASLQAYTFGNFDGDEDLDAIIMDREGIFFLENIDPLRNKFNHLPRYYLSFSELNPDLVYDPGLKFELFAETNLDEDELTEAMVVFHYTDQYTLTDYRLLQQTGDFTFSPSSIPVGPLGYSYPPYLTDLNNDNLQDIVYYDPIYNRINRLLNLGDGSFAWPQSLQDNYSAPRLSSSDLDGDGKQDVLFDDGKIHWIINEENGSGEVFSTDYRPGTADKIAAVDWDRDGDFDFVKTYRLEGNTLILKNNGNDIFDQHEELTGSADFALIDLDRDGWQDLISGRSFYRNQQGKLALYPIFFFPSGKGFEIGSLTCKDLNGNGKSDIIIHAHNIIHSQDILYLVRSDLHAPVLQGLVFLDENMNGNHNASEPGLHNVKITIQNESEQWVTFSDELGRFYLYTLPDGNYSIRAEDLNHWQLTSAAELTTEISQSQDTTLTFGYAPTEPITSGDIFLNGDVARCDRPIELGVTVHNDGTLKKDFLVTLQYDPLLEFDTAVPAPLLVDTNNQTLTWRIDSLNPRQLVHIDPVFHSLDGTYLGNILDFSAELAAIEENNTLRLQYTTYKDTVRCSYDPNDKLVSPNRPDKSIDASEKLIYTIRFQNTGNDTAFEVRILDTLDRLLDPASIRPVSSSHAHFITIRDHVVEFLFPEINLPDSTTNYQGSMGYVQFAVFLREEAGPGDQVRNRAAIYFDLNAPIITNTTVSEIPAINAIAPSSDPESNQLRIYPNPGSLQVTAEIRTSSTGEHHFLLQDIMGRTLQRQSSNDGRTQFDISNLPPGLYLVIVLDRYGNRLDSSKLIK
ncbi:MAG: VCBS repeat-containing protein, partial [Lewinella sp.]|nr:VCBS repeat-containing protein [Lewinella sp.]